MDKDTLGEALILGVPAGVLGILGYLGHVLGYSTKRIKARPLIGGILLSGFVGLVCSLLLHQTGLNTYLVVSVSSTIGATGDRGFELIYLFAKAHIGGRDRDRG